MTMHNEFSSAVPATFISWLFITVFRLGAILVAGCLLYFPAFKDVWAGYVPIVAGAALLAGLIWWRERVESWVMKPGEVVFVVALVAWVTVVQVALLLWLRPVAWIDGLYVYREALAFYETGRMSPITYYAPGQIWYYGLLFKLFGPSHWVAQVGQIPLAALIPVVSYGIGRRVMVISRARLAASLVALYPGMLLYVLITPYYFYMYTLAILLVFYAWVRVAERPGDWLSAGWGGLVAGWGALTKATLVVAPVQGLFFWLVAGGSLFDKARWKAWLVFTALVLATIAPWQWRNVQVFGEPVLICTSGPLVFYSANNPDSNGLYSDIPDRVSIETPADMLAHKRWCNEQAKAFITSQPLAFARLVWMKFLHTWGTETSFVELVNRRGESLGVLDPAMRLVVQIGWSALVLDWAGMAGRALWRRSPATVLELAAGVFVLSKFLVYSVYEGGARHHMPAIPLLIVMMVNWTGGGRRKL